VKEYCEERRINYVEDSERERERERERETSSHAIHYTEQVA